MTSPVARHAAASFRWQDAGGVTHVGVRSSDLGAFRTRCGAYPPIGVVWGIDYRVAATCLWCAR